jgi:Uma2 family endonuclease
METSVVETEYTPEDLLHMEDGHRYELIDGHLVEKPMGAQSSRVAAILIRLLDAHATAHHHGLVFNSDCGYQSFPGRPKHVRFPDLSFIAQGRLPNDRPPAGHVRIAPDLAVEVVSPNDTAYDIEERVEDYLGAGVRLMWVVYPNTRRVMVFRQAGGISRLGEANQLEGEDVIRDFACPVAEVFAGI